MHSAKKKKGGGDRKKESEVKRYVREPQGPSKQTWRWKQKPVGILAGNHPGVDSALSSGQV